MYLFESIDYFECDVNAIFRYLKVLRKVCSDGSECRKVSIDCTEHSALCTLNKKCTNKCYEFPPNRDQYIVANVYLLTSKEGGYFRREVSNSSFRLLAGDLIAVRSKGAQLAHRTRKSYESPDYKITRIHNDMVKNTKITLSKDIFQEVYDVKHLIRITVSEPLVLTIPHQYNKIGNYSIKLSVSNDWTVKAVEREEPICIQSNLDILTFAKIATSNKR